MKKETENYFFSDFPRPIAFTNCAEIIDGIQRIFKGWNIRRDDTANSLAPIVKLHRPDGRYLWLSDRLAAPDRWSDYRPHTAVSAVADFHHSFYDWYSLQFPEHLCLHCAAVEIGGGLVIFPNVQKVGKSTLTTRLAMAGLRVFCDDVLAYCPERKLGLAFGILPRVRLPLPDVLPQDYRDYIAAQTVLGNKHYAYVAPQKGVFAEYGESLPIHGVVKLNRDASFTTPEISSITKAQSVSAVLHQNFVISGSVNQVFDQVLDMIAPCRLLELKYNDLDQATDALINEFKRGDG